MDDVIWFNLRHNQLGHLTVFDGRLWLCSLHIPGKKRERAASARQIQIPKKENPCGDGVPMLLAPGGGADEGTIFSRTPPCGSLSPTPPTHCPKPRAWAVIITIASVRSHNPLGVFGRAEKPHFAGSSPGRAACSVTFT